MTKQEALTLLRDWPHGVKRWNSLRERGEEIPDLSGADLNAATLNEVNLENANLSRANLHAAGLSNANLSKATLTAADLSQANLEGANLSSHACLKNANLSGANLTGADLSHAELPDANLSRATLRDAKLVSATLSYAELESARLNGADLTDANLNGASLCSAQLQDAILAGATLTRANFRRCNLKGANVRDANLQAAKYLFGPDRADSTGVTGAEFATYSFARDYFPWSRLRIISTLRIFGASYAACIAITIYAFLSRYWNTRLTRLHDWATTHKSDVSIEFWTGVLERIPPLPAPTLFGVQLIALGVLAAGATLYVGLCPEIIKETTESRWTRAMKEPLVEYRSAEYSGAIRRWACAVCFGAGGAYTLWYLVDRGVEAIRYLLS